jgi:hypothetical protein
MAKRDEPGTSKQRKSDKPVETNKKNSPELTDDELGKVSGGLNIGSQGGGGGSGKIIL